MTWTSDQPTSWTDERVAKLRELWPTGLSASQIAKVIGGISRNSVIGKVNRLGIAGRAPPARIAATEKPRVVDHRARISPKAMKPILPDKPLPTPRAGATMTTARHWETRLYGECAFPVGGESDQTISCCGPTDAGATYCPAHAAIMYAPPAKRHRPPIEPSPIRRRA